MPNREASWHLAQRKRHSLASRDLNHDRTKKRLSKARGFSWLPACSGRLRSDTVVTLSPEGTLPCSLTATHPDSVCIDTADRPFPLRPRRAGTGIRFPDETYAFQPDQSLSRTARSIDLDTHRFARR